VRAQATPSNRNDAKNEIYLTYDSSVSAPGAKAAPNHRTFYLEEEQEEDAVSASTACTFPDHE
jgi:hypothetical protein